MTSQERETLYHAPALLSRTYASILDRKTSPLLLIAEEVRRNSAEYPRPVPLDFFEQSPFDLTPEQIEVGLKTMAENPEFVDITYTPHLHRRHLSLLDPPPRAPLRRHPRRTRRCRTPAQSLREHDEA
jgi:hypothetical protein